MYYATLSRISHGNGCLSPAEKKQYVPRSNQERMWTALVSHKSQSVLHDPHKSNVALFNDKRLIDQLS
jgi:hypothetical protein